HPRCGCALAIPVERLGSPPGYPTSKILRKYSYQTCTFVILTKRRLALGFGQGRCGIRVPHRRRAQCAGRGSLFETLAVCHQSSAADLISMISFLIMLITFCLS